MPLRRPATLPELIACEIHHRLAQGHWNEGLPGLLRLSHEFSVSRETVEKALLQLTEAGVLAPAEHGRKRRVRNRPTTSEPISNTHRVRVGWFAWRPLATMDRSTREIISEVMRLSDAEGVELFVAPVAGSSLKTTARELETLTLEQQATAWIFQGGNVEIASWFAQFMKSHRVPCLAVGGRAPEEVVAQIGFDLSEQISVALDYLLHLGHRRIVLPLPPQAVGGRPVKLETAFRQRMEAYGVRVVPEYNLPITQGTPAGWFEQLQSLFGLTPPTAFILQHGTETAGLAGFLQRRSLRIPQDVSIIMEADEPVLQWLYPDASRIVFSSERIARQIWKWLRDATQGSIHPCRILIPGQFVPGTTSGPPPPSSAQQAAGTRFRIEQGLDSSTQRPEPLGNIR